jgi:hypothetical protein
MDGEDDVENMIKRVNRPGRTFTVGTANVLLQFYLRAENNLKLCVYFLKHMERVQHVPNAASITLDVVRGYREQQRYEEKFKKTVVEPDINDKDWHRTMESIRE